jgi:hypothetical protein
MGDGASGVQTGMGVRVIQMGEEMEDVIVMSMSDMIEMIVSEGMTVIGRGKGISDDMMIEIENGTVIEGILIVIGIGTDEDSV